MKHNENETRFYSCPTCDTIVGMIRDGGMPMSCCGSEMEPMPIHHAGDAGDAHALPHVTRDEYRIHVTVGCDDTACTPPDWIYLATDRGGQRKNVAGEEGCPPRVSFALADETPCAVYAYSDKYGLWENGIFL